MNDRAAEILGQVFQTEQTPLTEQQRQTARRACGFALVAFSNRWNDEKLRQAGVELSQEQLAFAGNLREVFPQPQQVLPKSEFGSAYQGYMSMVAYPIHQAIPTFLANEHTNFENWSDADDVRLLTVDPTGVSFLRRLLGKKEEESALSVIELQGKEREVLDGIVRILMEAQEIPDQPKPHTPPDDQNTQEVIDSIIDSAFGGNKSQREQFIKKSRRELRKRLPMELDQGKNPVPTKVLEVMGARLAFERWQTAVNIYLKRWGSFNHSPS